MRNRSLFTLALVLIALMAVGLVASGVALGQEPSRARPTATPAQLPEGYEVRAPEDPEALPDLVVQSIRLFPANPYAIPTNLYVVLGNNANIAVLQVDNSINITQYRRHIRGDEIVSVTEANN